MNIKWKITPEQEDLFETYVANLPNGMLVKTINFNTGTENMVFVPEVKMNTSNDILYGSISKIQKVPFNYWFDIF